ncbi:hypothetical protein [Polaribacter vadi]|uniref:hypothetical protein n=1 Tax=Polaribacter vadi TaxID=1774273 RepID=UPI0030ED8B1E|tara:strand:- start:4076 stop:4486 length:411 start_codon:yes stop_codon:yes gene_type:complete
MKSIKIIRWTIIIITTIVYTYFSFSFGFWLTGDMHSGGPLVGLFLTPFVFFLLRFIFFYQDIKTRRRTLISLLTFCLFFIYLIGISYFTDFIYSSLIDEEYFIYEYSFYFSLINWSLTVLLTFLTYKFLNKLIKRK